MPGQHPHCSAGSEQGAYDIGPNKTGCTSHQGCHTNNLHFTHITVMDCLLGQSIMLPGSRGEKNAGASAANGVLPPGTPTTSAAVAARAVGGRRDSRTAGVPAKSHQQLYRLPLAGTYSRAKRQRSSARQQRGYDSGRPSGRRYTTPCRPPVRLIAVQALASPPPAPPQSWY